MLTEELKACGWSWYDDCALLEKSLERGAWGAYVAVQNRFATIRVSKNGVGDEVAFRFKDNFEATSVMDRLLECVEFPVDGEEELPC